MTSIIRQLEELYFKLLKPESMQSKLTPEYQSYPSTSAIPFVCSRDKELGESAIKDNSNMSIICFVVYLVFRIPLRLHLTWLGFHLSCV